jgi:tetratricopeptide (TPR) repeat protein
MPAEDHLRPRRHSLWETVPLFVGTSLLTVVFLGMFAPSFFVVMALFTVVFAAFWTARRRQVWAVDANMQAIKLLNAGHVQEAGEKFEELARTEQRTWGHAVFVFNRGVAHMLEGRLQRAFSIFNAVYYSRAFRWGAHRGYEPLLLIEMGSCAALMGWTKEANDYLTKAKKLLPHDEFPRLVILEALLAARRGNFREVVTKIRDNWTLAEDVVRPPTLRSLRVLMAFSMERLGMTQTADFELLIEAARPEPGFGPNEYDYLGVEWPEMRDFLVRYSLTSRTVSPSTSRTSTLRAEFPSELHVFFEG